MFNSFKVFFLLGAVLVSVSGCNRDDPPAIPRGQSLADPTGGHGPGGAKAHGEATHSAIHTSIDRGKPHRRQDVGAKLENAASPPNKPQ